MQEAESVKLEEQSITILRDNRLREVSKEKLETFLFNMMEEMCDLLYLCELREYYVDAFEWLISNLYRTAGIQLYEDGEIRINLTWSEIYRTECKCIFLGSSNIKNRALDNVLFDELQRILVLGM